MRIWSIIHWSWSSTRVFNWRRNRWPWMKLNSVMTAVARYLSVIWASCKYMIQVSFSSCCCCCWSLRRSSMILIRCSSLVRRRCNLALFATVVDSLATIVSIRFIWDSSDVSRDVCDVTQTTSSSISCQRKNKSTIHETTWLWQDFSYFLHPSPLTHGWM